MKKSKISKTTLMDRRVPKQANKTGKGAMVYPKGHQGQSGNRLKK